MTEQFFPLARNERWRPILMPLGVRPTDGVTLTADGLFRATFGRYRVETPLDNIRGASVSGPHRWYTAVGLRLSFRDDGLTFGSDHRRGACVEFVERVPKVIGFRPHSALWVSVADPEALVEALVEAVGR